MTRINLCRSLLAVLAGAAALMCAVVPAQAAEKKPNILFIMGDDIGWMQPSIYHRGLMVGETPNIDRIGREGAMFTDYVAMQSCTSGRNGVCDCDRELAALPAVCGPRAAANAAKRDFSHLHVRGDDFRAGTVDVWLRCTAH